MIWLKSVLMPNRLFVVSWIMVSSFTRRVSLRKSRRRNRSRSRLKKLNLDRQATDEGDYQVKLRNLKRFLEDGDKAKVTLKFKGREMAHQELGLEVLKRIEEDLADVAVVESQSKVEGKQAIMVLAPKKK